MLFGEILTMRSNSRGWKRVETWAVAVLAAGGLAVSGCAVKGDDDDSSGSGGTQAATAPVGDSATGTGGAAPAAQPATGSGGTPAVVMGVSGAAAEPGPDDEGTGGVPAGTGGATEVPAPDGGMMPPPPPAVTDLGMGDGSDVVTIGDSWMQLGTNGGGVEGALDRAGTSYRHRAFPGTTLAGQIPGQYDQLHAENPDIKTVIMTGGGNDIMFSGGCNTKEACEQSVMQIVMQLDTLWTKMAMDGVKDIFYINYSKNVGTAPSDTRPTDPPPPPSICLTGMVTCHSLDTSDLVPAGDSPDGIHPSLGGCDRIAAAVLKQMEEAGARR